MCKIISSFFQILILGLVGKVNGQKEKKRPKMAKKNSVCRALFHHMIFPTVVKGQSMAQMTKIMSVALHISGSLYVK